MLFPIRNDKRSLLDLSGLWDFQLDPDGTGAENGWRHGLRELRPIAAPDSWNEQFQDTLDYLTSAW